MQLEFPHYSFCDIETRVEGTDNEEICTALPIFMKIGISFLTTTGN